MPEPESMQIRPVAPLLAYDERPPGCRISQEPAAGGLELISYPGRFGREAGGVISLVAVVSLLTFGAPILRDFRLSNIRVVSYAVIMPLLWWAVIRLARTRIREGERPEVLRLEHESLVLEGPIPGGKWQRRVIPRDAVMGVKLDRMGIGVNLRQLARLRFILRAGGYADAFLSHREIDLRWAERRINQCLQWNTGAAENRRDTVA